MALHRGIFTLVEEMHLKLTYKYTVRLVIISLLMSQKHKAFRALKGNRGSLPSVK